MKRGEPFIVRALWAIILAGCVGGILVYVFGCHFHAHFHMGGQSQEPQVLIDLSEKDDV